MNIMKLWRRKAYSFANPIAADEWLVEHVQRLNERLDSAEKAITDLQDKQIGHDVQNESPKEPEE